MLLSKSGVKHLQVDSPPPIKRGKKVLYGCTSMMLALMIGVAPYAQADEDGDKKFKGTIQFTKAKYDAYEMAGHVTLWVERSGGERGPLTVMYGTTSGSANAGSDYRPKMGKIMWADDDAEKKPIMIHINPDPAEEKKRETFYVTLLDVAPMDTMPPPPADDEGAMDDDAMMPPSPDAMMPEYGMMDDTGNPTTVYFGAFFRTKVDIVDNAMPPPPPVEPLPPRPPLPPCEPGQIDCDPAAGMPKDDDSPPVIASEEPPVTSEGDEKVEVAIDTNTFTNIFSLEQKVVVKAEVNISGIVEVLQSIATRLTIGASRKMSVGKARIKFKFSYSVRSSDDSDDDGFTEEEVNAFLDLVESLFSVEIDRKTAIEDGVLIGSLGDLCLPTEDNWVCINPLTVNPAITTTLAEAIIASNPDAKLIINQDGTVTYVPAEGSPITVIPDAKVTSTDVVDVNVTIDGDTIVVEGNGLSQTFYLVKLD